MFDQYCNLKKRNLLEDYEIEINYMTYSQVKRKRYELYKKKLMFQKQLMNLKEKGKRLQKVQDLEHIALNAEVQIYSKATQQKMKELMRTKLLNKEVSGRDDEIDRNL